MQGFKQIVSRLLTSTAWFLLEWSLFGLLALAATRPLANHWMDSIPRGTEPTSTVPLFNLWTLGWNLAQAEQGFPNYWQAPIFAPVEGAFAFSEPQPMMALLLPIRWCGGSDAMAYNLYLWFGLSLSGVVASRLMGTLTQSPLIGFLAGALIVILPYTHWQLGVIQLVPMVGVLGTIMCLKRYGELPTVWRSAALGFVFAITYFLCNYHGLFLSLLLIVSGGWLLGRNIINWKTWAKLLPGALVSLAMIGPMIAQQRHVAGEHEWTRPADLIKRQSAQWGDLTAAPWTQMLPLPEFVSESRSGWMLSPGYLKMLLAVVGIVAGVRYRPTRLFTLFLVTFTLAAYLLSLGLNLTFGSFVPYEWIRTYYPGLKMARNVYRFVVFAQVGVVLLASLGLFGVLTGFRADANNAQKAVSNRWVYVAVALGFLAVIEIWPGPQKLFQVPDITSQTQWIEWIEENTEPNEQIACVPFPKGRNASDYFDNVVWMYHGLEHGRPLANGYSGFFPSKFLTLKNAMGEFPDAKSVELLLENGVRYVIISRDELSRGELEENPHTTAVLQWMFGDHKAQVDIYRVVRETPTD